MKVFGLIGHPLTHSFSKKYFEEKFEKFNIKNCVYNLFDIDNIEKVADLKNEKNIVGLNVTIPYKEAVLKYLDEVSPVAEQIGSVNTIKCSKNRWKGFNTDYFGILQSIKSLPLKNIKSCLILGSGGTAKTAAFVLNEMKIDFLTVSRNKRGEGFINYKEINSETLKNYNLIINTSPVGMYPKVIEIPELPYQLLNKTNILFDMIYNPQNTLFLQKGREKGCKTLNGMEALKTQAEVSWKIWNE
ncbi:MAG: shikimate dehydrogenase [Bacteroidetes bacterium]|nr:shikimate dehydrogenase [Bacteroidota bacterium]